MTDDQAQPPPSQRFDSLDDYLAWRKGLGAADAPWYEEVRPGVFQYKAGRSGHRAPPELFTRADLLRRYGFER